MKCEVLKLQKSVDRAKVAKMSLWEKYHAGGITAESFQKENENADGQVRRHGLRIAELQNEIAIMETAVEQGNDFVERFSGYGGLSELTREVVERFVGEVRVFSPEKIEVVFSFADEYRVMRERVDEFRKERGKRKVKA